MGQQLRTDLSEIIAENFGANATYVEGLLGRFRANPESVDESWRSYFTELLGDSAASTQQGPSNYGGVAQPQADGGGAAATLDGDGLDGRKTVGTVSNAGPATAAAAEVKQSAPTPAQPSSEQQVEIIPIRGAALKIVENMEASLSVPTATSQRRIPVKLLDENRRLINKHLQENNRGKASYTHLIAWALLRALDEFPQLNDGYDVVDGKPVRLRRPDINLGIAIDLAKKDGTRTLMVPVIRDAGRMPFAAFLAAYDALVEKARTNTLSADDLVDGNITLTNPGGIGTVASVPRLMVGQGTIVATGSIAYPVGLERVAKTNSLRGSEQARNTTPANSEWEQS